MDETFVRTRRQCRECDGSGITTSAAWGQYFRDPRGQQHEDNLRRIYGPQVAAEHAEKWFRERGFLREDNPMLGFFAWTFPPEEENCSECCGSGWEEKWTLVGELFPDGNTL